MTKKQLATELKQRQYEKKYCEKWMIDRLSDDQIIDSYNTCNCCGEKQVEGEKLDLAISLSNNAEDFFAVCDEMSQRKH